MLGYKKRKLVDFRFLAFFCFMGWGGIGKGDGMGMGAFRGWVGYDCLLYWLQIIWMIGMIVIIMIHGQHLKCTPYTTPLFHSCTLAQPLTPSPSSPHYLILPNNPHSPQNNPNPSKYICPVFANETDNCTFIALEGEDLGEYLEGRAKEGRWPLMTQEDVWAMAVCLVEGFVGLGESGGRLEHFKEYSVRRIQAKNLYKIIYHESMVSQLEAAKSQRVPWHKLYLSPQQLNNEFLPQKSIVFSFSLMLLHICSYQSQSPVYKPKTFQIDPEALAHRLEVARQQNFYSNLLCNFIKQGLELDGERRWDFGELRDAVRRKLERQFLRQSDLLTRVSQLGGTGGVKYDVLMPSGFQFVGEGRDCMKGHHRARSDQIPAKHTVKDESQQGHLFKSSASREQSPKPTDSKVIKLKKKASMKFQGSKVSKPKNQTLETNKSSHEHIEMKDQPKTNIFNFEYRGTFGSRYVNDSPEMQQNSSTGKKIKSTNKKYSEESEKESQGYEGLRERIEPIPATKIEFQSGSQTKQVPSKKAEILIEQSLSQTSQNPAHSQPDTPKGFGKQHPFSFKPVPEPFSSSPQTSLDPPALLTKMSHLNLDYCLHPVQELAQDIGKIGVWVQGDLYYGDFVHGRREGLGLEIFANQEYYYGFFKEDLFYGEGFYYWNAREYFFGRFELGQKVSGRLEGQIKYQGGFKENKRSGYGTCWYSTGQIYTGSWLNGKKHGKGRITEPDGSKFTGQWVKGKRRGPGTLETDSMKIIGIWNDETIEGQAEIQYSNGDIFQGKIGKTLEKINGKYRSKTGRIFVGDFENDMPKRGELIYSNGDKYIGELQNLRRHGYGQYYYSTGEVYKGLWQNNIKKQ